MILPLKSKIRRLADVHQKSPWKSRQGLSFLVHMPDGLGPCLIVKLRLGVTIRRFLVQVCEMRSPEPYVQVNPRD